MVPPHPLDVVKPPEEESDGSRPTASSSNDPTIPVPTTTPHSFAPSAAGPADNADIDYDTPQPGSQETIQLLFMIRWDGRTRWLKKKLIMINRKDPMRLNRTPYDSECVQFEGDYFA